MGNGWGLGPPGPRVPVEAILLFLLSKFGGRSWPGVRVANLSVCEMAAIGVLVIMAASPSLSHSSQNKALRQGLIENNQEVSDECGSGVVRVVQEAPSIPA